MTIKELIEILQNYSDDAKVNFYNFMRGDDMYFKNITASYEGDEIYFNIG
jgi:hypothetical protein